MASIRSGIGSSVRTCRSFNKRAMDLRITGNRIAGSAQREDQSKFRAPAKRALDMNAAVHLLGDMFDDRKSKARAAGLTGASLVDAVEALEDARQVIAWDADAIVRNRNAQLILRHYLTGNSDLAARLIEANGIVEKVHQSLLEP